MRLKTRILRLSAELVYIKYAAGTQQVRSKYAATTQQLRSKLQAVVRTLLWVTFS